MNPKAVCLLLGLCQAGAAAAIGLGELSVRSHLGQPLHATVVLIDPPPATAGDCFAIAPGDGDINPPARARMKVEQHDGQTLLHIRTPQAIDDPVAQFTLVYGCATALQREYVILLDPPVAVAPPATATPAAAPAPAPAPSVPTAASAPAARPADTPRPRRVQAAASRPAAAAPPRRPPASAPAARPTLVLSGRQPAAEAAAIQPQELSVAELADENTALARRLAHLEMQLAQLQQRNAELEARRVAVPVVPPPASAETVRWPLYLLALALLLGAGLLFARRRHRPAAAMPATVDLAAERMASIDDDAPQPPRMAEIAAPASDTGTEVKEDILDQAEVFMAHGHGDLATHLLQEHLREAPTESPVPWLLLLDLLYRAGDTAAYATASAECRRYFNVNLSGYPVSQDSEPGVGLEAYPHLLELMVKVWNTPEVDGFFLDLIYDHRGGTRIGFEPGAYRDILLLRDIALQVSHHPA